MKLFLLSLAFSTPLFAAAPQWQPGDAPETILVTYKQSATSAERAALNSSLGGHSDLDLPLIGLQRVLLPGNTPSELDAAMNAYRASPLVLAAEPDHPTKIAAVWVPPNDPLYRGGQQWYLTATAWPQAAEAWTAGNIQLLATVKVAVVDTGVDLHNDLVGQLLSGTSFVAAEPSTDDQNGHGTFCAGLIAAAYNGNSGTAGAFFDTSKVKILPVKVLNGCGSGSTSDLASGVLYAVLQGARVINMSIQASQGSVAMENAVNEARNQGVLVVAAAGNDYGGPTSYPAAYSQVMAVGALNHSDGRASYGNFGKLEISAPGGDLASSSGGCLQGTSACCPYEIWSLAHNHASCASPSNSACGFSNSIEAGAGTSFAAPLVSAAAALLFSQDPGRRVEDVQRILMQTASATAYGSGFHVESGWGKLNFAGALGYAATTQTGGQLKAYNWPNPFNPEKDRVTTLTFIQPESRPAKLRLLDAGGDLVKQWDLSSAQGGLNFVAWDGRNGVGNLVSNGVYTLVVEVNGARAQANVAVLH